MNKHEKEQANMYFFRERLMDKIKRAAKKPLVFVEAGAGYGKTLAVQQFLEKSDAEYLWLNITQMDNIPELFWNKYANEFMKKDKAAADGLRAIQFPSSPQKMKQYLHLLSRQIDKHEQVYAVIDDFQMITEPAIIRFIEEFLKSALDNHCLILICSNEQYLLNRDNYINSGLAELISHKDLSFTEDEIKEYMNILSISCPNSICNNIFSFTEGWPLAVHLIALYLKSGHSFHTYKEHILPIVFELMEKEIYNAYSVELQYALIEMSLMNQYDRELIKNVTGVSVEKLENASKHNFFIRFNGDDEPIYMHYLFKEFLKLRQGYLNEEEKKRILKVSAKWYSKKGNTYEAIESYIRLGDFESVLNMMQALIGKTMNINMAGYFLDILDIIPVFMQERHPEIFIYYGYLLLCINKLEEAEEKLLYFLGLDDCCGRIHGEILLLLGLVRFNKKETDFDKYFVDAWKYIPDGSRYIGRDYILVDANNGFASKALKYEEIQKMLMAYEKGFPYFQKMTNGCGAGIVELAMAEIHFYQTKYGLAEEYAYTALRKAEKYEQKFIIGNCYFYLYRISMAKGDYITTMKYIHFLEDLKIDLEKSSKNSYGIDTALAMFYMRMGQYERIPRWLVEEEIYVHTPQTNMGRNFTLRCQWILLGKNNLIEATAYLNKAEEIIKNNKHLFSLMYLYLLKSIMLYYSKEYDKMVAAYEQAYLLGGEAGFLLFFIESAAIARTVANAVAEHGGHNIPVEWLEMVRTKSNTYAKRFSSLQQLYMKKHSLLPQGSSHLSKKECEILERLCQGLSRIEIAGELNITENTVKGKLKTIYNKLNALNLADAVHIYTLIRKKEKLGIMENYLEDIE